MTPEEPSDPEVRTVQLSRGPLAYTDEGSGPVLVAVHGLPGSVRDFRWLASALDGALRLIRLDLPGHGGTPRSTGPALAMERRADVIVEAVAALGIDRAVVMGHSMGGPLVTCAALADPERFAGVALLASAGLTRHRGTPPRLLSWGLRIPLVARLMRGGVRAAFDRRGFPTSLTDDERVLSLQAFGGISFRRHARNLRALRVPTLIAWTEDDRLVEPAIAEGMYWATPPGPRICFGDGGHNLQKTRAIELAEALVVWVPQVLGETPAGSDE